MNKPINTQKIEELFEGSPEDLAEFIKVILTQFEAYKKELTIAVEAYNHLAVKDLRHKIKSICLSFDIPFILDYMHEIKELIEINPPDCSAIEQKLQLVLENMDMVIEELTLFQNKL